jgi:hypothetical protein
MQVQFVGYTPSLFSGDLGGRTGAQAKCGAAYPGSHFCTNWEIEQAAPPAPASTAWVDRGRFDQQSRLFRIDYSPSDVYSCAGWTSSSASQTLVGGGLVRSSVITSLGEITSTWVSNTDGGCQIARPLSCCMGGTAIRLRGYTTPRTGALGGRSGANSICAAAFAGSRFCTNWEMDQAAVAAPVPASGVWMDAGSFDVNDRRWRIDYSPSHIYTCGGWTTASPTTFPLGTGIARGPVFTPLGEMTSSWVSNTDGGCQTARPLACCDGYPPR